MEHVAEAAVVALEPGREEVQGVYGVRGMRELIGWEARTGEDQAEVVQH